MKTVTYSFEDDGIIPNSVFPLVVHKSAFEPSEVLADEMEAAFAKNNWGNSWRNGVFPYHHYHSNTHEVVGIYAGKATLHLGGEKGERVTVAAGDVIIIPAGTGHKKVESSDDFAVLGAYPGGADYDLMTGKEGERPAADGRIARVPFPDTDPVTGTEGGIIELWK